MLIYIVEFGVWMLSRNFERLFKLSIMEVCQVDIRRMLNQLVASMLFLLIV